MRAAVVCVVALALAPAAGAATPVVSASASTTIGRAPLDVTLRADGDAASYRWDLGDGSSAEGPAVRHVYARPGVYTALVTAVAASGETATATVTVSAFRLALAAPRTARLAQRVRFRGRLVPPLVGASVAVRRGKLLVGRVRTGTGGRFVLPVRIGAPGPWTARWSSIRSTALTVRIRPELRARLVGGSTVGSRLEVVARVRPAAAGRLRVEIRSGRRLRRVALIGPPGRLAIWTGRPGTILVRVSLVARPGYGRAVRRLATTVVQPDLTLGARGPSVRALEARLSELRYALRGVDGLYAYDTFEAVLAFQKVEGLPWTGRVDATVWRRLAAAHAPRARYPGDHIEISKGRQVLFLVRAGLVTTVVHVSTGATGNTPIGRWRVYRKVVGWDWVLWFPMYFLRGFAIHGYPSVPAYPASHGCVRVPMWIAPSLYAANPYGQTVYVYW